MSYFSVLLGVMTFVAGILDISNVYLGLGAGGMERMLLYPMFVWAIGFGGNLMALEDKPRKEMTPCSKESEIPQAWVSDPQIRIIAEYGSVSLQLS